MTTYLEKSLFIRFTASAFRKLPPIYVFSYFPFGFVGRMWDLIVPVPDHCLSFYFSMKSSLVYSYISDLLLQNDLFAFVTAHSIMWCT